MRINDHIVIQLIESEPPKLVIVDEQTGVELLVFASDVAGIRERMDEVTSYGVAGAEMMIHDEGHTVALTMSDLALTRCALDYFESALGPVLQ